ncbi:hypothetical protein AB0F92_13420 [Kitasatospora aureofaciens]|uniref:Uncharacterized protein n=1 Tax=Kitasatospora aureofaciens TaxID=1894 RepID=A0A1E7NG84_KITAU|nr:hypothetical protein [Kitasatospora aureofaciens]OEV39721.1 hypothetical protein HS99_0003420 [Kitasatospora aureofaciens]UKZ10333.1 hypothetical protein BOQ63_041265 [Streptomyces viridifaciens]
MKKNGQDRRKAVRIGMLTAAAGAMVLGTAVHDALALPPGSAVVVDAPADHSLRPEFTDGHRNHLRHGLVELPAGPPG